MTKTAVNGSSWEKHPQRRRDDDNCFQHDFLNTNMTCITSTNYSYFHQLPGAENIPHGKFLAIKTLEGRNNLSAKSELIFSTAEWFLPYWKWQYNTSFQWLPWQGLFLKMVRLCNGCISSSAATLLFTRALNLNTDCIKCSRSIRNSSFSVKLMSTLFIIHVT